MPKENQTRKFDIHRANLNQFSRQNRPIINPIPIHQLIHPGKNSIVGIFLIEKFHFFMREIIDFIVRVGLLISNDLFSNGKQ